MRLACYCALWGFVVICSSVFGEECAERKPGTMDPKNVMAYFEMFLDDPAYTAEAAAKTLGEVEYFYGAGAQLTPKIPDVVSAALELLPEDPSSRPQSLQEFLCGVALDFHRDKALLVSFAELTRKFGEPHELPLPPPRLLPGQPYRPDYTFAFDAKGKAFRGSLFLTVDGKRTGDVNRVIRVSFRRYSRKPGV